MELYLYGPIFSFTAEEDILPQFEQAAQMEQEQVALRVNSPGGSVAAGWGIAAKMAEMEPAVNVKIDGVAASMAAVIAMFADNVQALDVSQLMLHRASGAQDTEEERNLLKRVNANLKAKMKDKIDAEKFKEIAGVTLDQLFNENEERYNVWLTATQAKQIGLVDSIKKLDNNQTKAEFAGTQIAALNAGGQTIYAGGGANAGETTNKNQSNMTVEEIKAQYPQAFEAIKAEGVNQERERVASFLEYHDADPQDVVNRVKQGEELTQSVREAYIKKLQTNALKNQMQEESPATVEPNASQEGESGKDEAQAFWDNYVKPLKDE
jgi:ATP-dependent protease ClpP protease subunit